ncbi:DEAD/DEAH box helicase family protein [Pontibacter silvestris]|uniref:DEAD/DEAH box helicase family protein n=1 Tax=Pontibacter silvestris TaxID=2305183 RepID=A0ABW4X215_9BACT|nr:DEAD/DEAH box helicase family protein [Pontibacter silvestris]MCC9134987.1 DEAD/DEAH box helicase family protein [Pontibacter silvestris]
MLGQVNFPLGCVYKSGREDEPLNFFVEALPKSKSFDLLLGYFSFSAVNVLALGFAHFIANGGKMRMVINDVLSIQDKETIIDGQNKQLHLIKDYSNDFNALKESLSGYGEHFFNCLSWLIAKDRIEIVAIRPKGGNGISHYKSGSFSDGVDKIHFTGSCNFTAKALLENLEEITIRRSWISNSDKEYVDVCDDEFNTLIHGKADYVEYVDASEIKGIIRDQYGDKDLEELLIEEEKLLKLKKSKVNNNLKLQNLLGELEISYDNLKNEPRFPFAEGPRDYQKEAYDNWVKNNYQGVFAMATGTGKTITSLNCLLQEYQKGEEQVYHALILVPTITLVNQWEEEAKEFNFKETIKVSSKYSWEKELATALSTSKRIPTSFIVIATYASFIKTKFSKYLKDFPTDTVFIADEAHNIGSPSILANLSLIHFTKRIGLSATPKRVYDPSGTAAMSAFFNDEEPFTYSFTMERAIDEGILCKYFYHPHLVKLTKDEMEKYIEITKKLAKFYSADKGVLESNDIVEKLLLQRKRIVHKADNKLDLTTSILKERFSKEKSLKFTFVYVPEGSKEDIYEADTGSDEDVQIIKMYTREIAKIDDSLMVNQFISGMADRNEILEQFKEGKIHVVASMKCLDEGVDIPRAEHAIFCSSTGNPRQFIQRRGRILRRHRDKDYAVIHDLVVIPSITSGNTSDTFRVERSLVKKELERVMYFASLSLNPYETEEVLKKICEHYDLNIYTIFAELKAS